VEGGRDEEMKKKTHTETVRGKKGERGR